MKIEYIYPDPDDDKDICRRIREFKKQNTLGCLVSLLTFLAVVFIFLTLLPFILAVLGWLILFLGIYVLYKAYLEEFVLELINWLKSKR